MVAARTTGSDRLGGLNLALVGLTAWALHRVLRQLDRDAPLFGSTFPWALVLLLVLSSGSLQVGQYSVLLVACWTLYLLVAGKGQAAGAALLLGLPAAVKFYPALLWATPVALRRWREVLWLPVMTLVPFALVPLLVYGPRAWELTAGYFWGNISGEVKRLDHLYDLNAPSTEGLDLVLLRYLTHDPDFHGQYPWWPHADLPAGAVHLLANLARLAILAVSAIVACRFGARQQHTPRFGALLLMALWAATLYVILPEMKSRYAVYTFPAFLPLLAQVARARRGGQRRRATGLIVLVILAAAALVQLTPKPWRMCGPGLLGALLVWLSVLLMMRQYGLQPREG